MSDTYYSLPYLRDENDKKTYEEKKAYYILTLTAWGHKLGRFARLEKGFDQFGATCELCGEVVVFDLHGRSYHPGRCWAVSSNRQAWVDEMNRMRDRRRKPITLEDAPKHDMKKARAYRKRVADGLLHITIDDKDDAYYRHKHYQFQLESSEGTARYHKQSFDRKRMLDHKELLGELDEVYLVPDTGTIVHTRHQPSYKMKYVKIEESDFDNRQMSSTGKVIGSVPGYLGAMWWVEHDNGKIAPYFFTECYFTNKADREKYASNNTRRKIESIPW